MFFIVLLFFKLINCLSSSELYCNLIPQSPENIILCNLRRLNLNQEDLIQAKSNIKYPILVDDKQNLIWNNNDQPFYTRWSDLCPKLDSVYQYKNTCINQNNCDKTGICKIRLLKDKNITIDLIDNSRDSTENINFNSDTRFINLTIDFETLSFDAEGSNEILLIESTDKIDLYRSKPNRVLKEFYLEQLKDSSFKFECNIAFNDSIPFTIRHDHENEKLYIKMTDKNLKLDQRTCFLYNILIKQDGSIVKNTKSILLISLFDNRYERPVFDQKIYNFTIYENSPINNIIGKVNAVHFAINKTNNSIKYRIVPMISFENDQVPQFEFKDNDEILNEDLPVKIDESTGIISTKLNIDREYFLFNSRSAKGFKNGILTFTIQASFDSILHSYCKVNININDINDNPPIAHLKSASGFHVQNENSVWNIYVNEKNSINGILAYVGVYDPDSSENGTIKSIELTLNGYKTPSKSILNERKYKVNRLRTTYNNSQLYINLNSSVSLKRIPLKLNKIDEKLYTIQLIENLCCLQAESFSIEMKIQDNGTNPQLETKTHIQLNLLKNNNYEPVFINRETQIELIEKKLYDQEIIYKFEAIDLDDGLNGQVEYFIANQFDKIFDLNKDTGELKLKGFLSFKDLNSQFINLTVIAKDRALKNCLSSKFNLKIKIIDINDNKPEFEAKYFNFVYNLNQKLDKRYQKVVSSIYLTDFDSYETNSQSYLDIKLNKTKYDIKNGYYSKNSDEKFRFRDFKCFKSLSFNFITKQETNPFLILIENDSNETINYTKCKLSIWLDSNIYKQKNETQYNFVVEAKDNGVNSEENFSSSEFFIKINNKIELSDEILYLSSSNKSEINLNLTNSEKFIIKSISKIYMKSNEIKLSSIENNYVSKMKNKIIIEDLETGVFLVDYQINNIISNEVKNSQIKIISSDENSFKLFSDYEILIQNILNSQDALFNLNQDSPYSLNDLKNILFGSKTQALRQTDSIFKFILNDHFTFKNFLFISIFVFVFIIILLLFYIFIKIKKICNIKIKNENFSTEYDRISNKLNVKDDKDLKKQTPVIININHHKTAVSSNYSESDSSDIIQNQLNQGKTEEIIQKLTKASSLSTRSSICISDEGCYGSSDISSEKSNMSKDQIQIKINPRLYQSNLSEIKNDQILNTNHNIFFKSNSEYEKNLNFLIQSNHIKTYFNENINHEEENMNFNIVSGSYV